jgi:hypothetical protein
MLFSQARTEVACRYRTGRVALRETARLKIVPQVREEVNRRSEKLSVAARAQQRERMRRIALVIIAFSNKAAPELAKNDRFGC